MFKRITNALGAELPEWAMFFGFGIGLLRVIDYVSARLDLPWWAETLIAIWELLWLLIGIVCVSQVVRAARKPGAK